MEESSSYRPLCMLDSAGKLLERLILHRINDHLDETGQRAETQFGFRSGRSTIDAIERIMQAAHGAVQHRDICVLVSLDITNAFNSAPWLKIDAALQRCGIPRYLNDLIRAYLHGRSLLVGEEQLRREVTCGVPQGSVLGPALWNIMYDNLLDIEVPAGAQLVAFADDVAIIGIARTGEHAEAMLNPIIERLPG